MISVVVCTHNPKPEYIQRALAGLRAQTLSMEVWELLLVDNCSAESVAHRFDISWHAHGRHLREEVLGLTPARLCGMRNAVGKLLVFVDDDNVLASNYLEECLRISDKYSLLGVWGGQQLPEFEAEPPVFAKPLLGYLACRTFETAVWSNIPFAYESMPNGAGICVRREVAQQYLNLASGSAGSKAIKLGRVGQQLTSCEDHDIGFTACDLGMGMGVFPELRLLHIIPQQRLEKGYLLRLVEGDAYSSALLKSRRGFYVAPTPTRNMLRAAARALRKLIEKLKGRQFELQVRDARERGHLRALQDIDKQLAKRV